MAVRLTPEGVVPIRLPGVGLAGPQVGDARMDRPRRTSASRADRNRHVEEPMFIRVPRLLGRPDSLSAPCEKHGALRVRCDPPGQALGDHRGCHVRRAAGEGRHQRGVRHPQTVNADDSSWVLSGRVRSLLEKCGTAPQVRRTSYGVPSFLTSLTSVDTSLNPSRSLTRIMAAFPLDVCSVSRVPLAPDASVRKSPCRLPWINAEAGPTTSTSRGRPVQTS